MDLEQQELSRRGAVAAAAMIGSGAFAMLGGLLVPTDTVAQPRHGKTKDGDNGKSKSTGKSEGEGGEEDVSAVEDLMREHGVLRRTLIVYNEAAGILRVHPDTVDGKALADAARLFRSFGENYHERLLEEQHIFPEVRTAGGPAADLVEVLLRQHQRGREITDYIERVSNNGKIGTGDVDPLTRVLEAMVRMYNAHATWEDTVVFQAWKKRQSKARLDDLAEQFEQIEHQQFGKDGFDDALDRIEKVEQTLGLADLNRYTAASPPS
jgi:hemerythrin-like domain-containing protein